MHSFPTEVFLCPDGWIPIHPVRAIGEQRETIVRIAGRPSRSCSMHPSARACERAHTQVGHARRRHRASQGGTACSNVCIESIEYKPVVLDLRARGKQFVENNWRSCDALGALRLVPRHSRDVRRAPRRHSFISGQCEWAVWFGQHVVLFDTLIVSHQSDYNSAFSALGQPRPYL